MGEPSTSSERDAGRARSPNGGRLAGRPHVVIVGGGFGGLHAARALARSPVRVTLVDRRNHHLFQPLLYQVATAGLSPGDIAHPIRAVLRRQRNVTVFLGEVVAFDVSSRTVRMRDGAITYDFLVVAAGGRHAYFGHDEWERFAPGLKSLEDALEIRRRILLAFERAERESSEAGRRRLLTFIIVGGGPTGVEMAGAIAEIAREVMVRDFRRIDPRESRVVLIEAGARILESFPERLSHAAEESLRRRRVEVRLACPVTGVDEGAVLCGGERIEAGTIVWAAGVAASPIARTLGAPLDKAGRVLVKPDLTIPDHPEVYVIGDLASLAGPAGRPLPGVAPVAIQQGAHAARNIIRTLRGAPRAPFRYRDRGNLATIGRAAAVADLGRFEFSGWFAWLVWLVVHIRNLVGFRNRLIVLVQWAWAYVAFQRGARLIIGDLEDSGRTSGGARRG